jgi:hypothetical protein
MAKLKFAASWMAVLLMAVAWAAPVAAQMPGAAVALIDAPQMTVPVTFRGGDRYGYRGYYGDDPYGYVYVEPDYYPHYDSHHWKPAWAYRRPSYDYELPPYYEAWGYPSERHPRRWSRRHHDRYDGEHYGRGAKD